MKIVGISGSKTRIAMDYTTKKRISTEQKLSMMRFFSVWSV